MTLSKMEMHPDINYDTELQYSGQATKNSNAYVGDIDFLKNDNLVTNIFDT